MSLRRLLLLLLLVLAPIPIAAAEPAFATAAASEDETLTAEAGRRERADRVSKRREQVFWAGSGLVLVAVAGGFAWVLRLPGGRVAAVSGQAAARESGYAHNSAAPPVTRTKKGQ